MWKSFVDEIEFLTQRGYDSMDVGNFQSAKHYFMTAASKAMSLIDINPSSEFQKLIETLLNMARNAENMRNPTNRSPRNKKTKRITRKSKSEIVSNEITEDENAEINIPLGRNLDQDHDVTWKPDLLMNGIVTITGGSGSGKTEGLKTLTNGLIKHGIPCIILDLHGDIEVDVNTISLDYRGLYGINPLELSSKEEIDGGPLPNINRLMNLFDNATRDKFSSTQKSWLRNLLKFAYLDHKIKQDDKSTWENSPPTFSYLLDLIKNPHKFLSRPSGIMLEYACEVTTDRTISAVVNRLEPILEHPAFNGKSKIPFDKLIKEPYRILLKPLNTVDMQFIAAETIITQIYVNMKSKGHIVDGSSKFRLFILIDEVKVLTGYRGKINDPYHILNVLATEARKFGIGLILASQVLQHFGRDIRSNAATKIILRTMDNDEAKACAKELKIKLDELVSMRHPGEGFIFTSKSPKATKIRLKQWKHQNLKIDISQFDGSSELETKIPTETTFKI